MKIWFHVLTFGIRIFQVTSDGETTKTKAPPLPDLLHMARHPISQMKWDGAGVHAIIPPPGTATRAPSNCLLKASAEGTCLEATMPADKEATRRLRGLHQLPRQSNSTPRLMGARVVDPQNQLTLPSWVRSR